jgi:hypothetical protein
LLGSGTGTFSTQVNYSVGTAPYGLVAADFNGDGNPDLAVASLQNSTVSILLNKLTHTATAVASGLSVPGSGTHAVDASYGGDSNFATSTSSTTSLTATGSGTALVLSAIPISSVFGQQVVLTGTLSPYAVGGLNTNGETITFYNGSPAIGTGTLTSGVATLNITSLPLGANSLAAVYPGDTNFGTSQSLLTYTVGAASTTTLALSSASVTSGTVVTFTATVSNSGSPVSNGLVTICDASATYCLNSALIGTAQLNSAGTAVIKLAPGVGIHSYKAVFAATTAFGAGTSSAQALTVTAPVYPTTTAISFTGTSGNYTLTGTVVGTGSLTLAPTGTVSFLDTSNSNASVGSATLGTATLAQTFATLVAYTAGTSPASAAIGDFNGDGIPDLVVGNLSSATVSVFLGTGTGTFGTGITYATGTSPRSVVVGDFDGDGNADLAVANSGSNTVSVLLGNGTGTFASQVTYATGSTPYPQQDLTHSRWSSRRRTPLTTPMPLQRFR